MPVFPNAKPAYKRLSVGNAKYNVTGNQKHKFTVPKGVVWEIETAHMKPGTSSTTTCYIQDIEGQIISYILTVGAGTAITWGPPQLSSASYAMKPWILTEGMSVIFNFGTAQVNGTDWIKLRVWEYKRENVLSN